MQIRRVWVWGAEVGADALGQLPRGLELLSMGERARARSGMVQAMVARESVCVGRLTARGKGTEVKAGNGEKQNARRDRGVCACA